MDVTHRWVAADTTNMTHEFVIRKSTICEVERSNSDNKQRKIIWLIRGYCEILAFGDG